MAITVSIAPSVPSAKVGDPITFTYTVNGAGPETTVVTGTVTVDGVAVPATATFEVTHVVAAQPPTSARLSNVTQTGALAYSPTVI